MIISFKGKSPKIDKTAFIAPTAVIIGDVEIGPKSSVWFGAVIRGDFDKIIIGRSTNIQDNCVLHVDPGEPIKIGDNVSVGHGAMLHGCKIGSNILIGIHSVILNGAIVSKDSIIGANSLVPKGNIIPVESLYCGTPSQFKRTLSPQEIFQIHENAEEYKELANTYTNSHLHS